MAIVVFPRKGNEYWPLPGDYPELTSDGKRAARVNAVSLEGKPYLDVAAWSFLREYYLFPTPAGMWYKHGTVTSPTAHYQWIADWSQHRLSITAAPRGSAKSTLCRENILRKLLAKRYWETVLLLAKTEFVADGVTMIGRQLEFNERIIEDFGVLKPTRGRGSWNTKKLQLTNGSMLTGMSVTGAVLGKRPHEIYLDDVEKSDDLVVCPTRLIEAFKSLLFNALFPMADEKDVAIRIIGTLLHRQTFLYWMQTTDDPRVRDYWFRVLHAAQWTDPEGEKHILWAEKMSEEWLLERERMMGRSAFGAQYLNDPGTEEERTLTIHDELCTYWMEEHDQALEDDPLHSKAVMVSHQLEGYSETDGKTPLPHRVTREFGPVASGMRRFITVDYANTISTSSDWSAVHVLGVENSRDFRDTLYSLDLWLGKCTLQDLCRHIFRLSELWQVSLIGVESYPVQQTMFEQIAGRLRDYISTQTMVPKILPIKFPYNCSKGDKIGGLAWRFEQYRIKLPIDRRESGAYWHLFDQIENFTPDLKLLQHDDAIDSLAMHQAIGKPTKAVAADVVRKLAPDEQVLEGHMVDPESGLSYVKAVDWTRMEDEQFSQILEAIHKCRVGQSEEPDYEAHRVALNWREAV